MVRFGKSQNCWKYTGKVLIPKYLNLQIEKKRGNPVTVTPSWQIHYVTFLSYSVKRDSSFVKFRLHPQWVDGGENIFVLDMGEQVKIVMV